MILECRLVCRSTMLPVACAEYHLLVKSVLVPCVSCMYLCRGGGGGVTDDSHCSVPLLNVINGQASVKRCAPVAQPGEFDCDSCRFVCFFVRVSSFFFLLSSHYFYFRSPASIAFSAPDKRRITRITQEIASLSNSLPVAFR